MEPFEEVYRRYFADVYRFSLSLCRDEDIAEDITQETFCRALKSLDQFRGQCQLKTWLFQIARNEWISHCRRDRRLTGLDSCPEPPAEGDLFEQLSDRETAFALHRALHRLPEPYKEVFTLRLFGELSFSQIAELFGKRENWARVTFFRAKQKLKEEFQ
ncbi:MAG: RNA polymerase sigma factor [Candidatus Onthomonas sp.]